MKDSLPKPLKVSEIKLTYQPKVKASERYRIMDSKDGHHFLYMHCYDLQTIEYRESFKAVFLNGRHKVLGFTTISEGGSCGTVVDIKQVVQACLLANAEKIIISHNHPTGIMQPSTYDDMTTTKLKKALDILDITLADHIIVSPDSTNYYSYADEGKL